MSEAFAELNQAELDGLIERVQQAAEHGLALSADDLQLLLKVLLSFAYLGAALARGTALTFLQPDELMMTALMDHRF